MILRTIDGGVTWILQSSPTNGALVGVAFTDAYAGTVVGAARTILRTDTGGW
jgi:photosystem II stability/assembly factor-like uncharacterized protein